MALGGGLALLARTRVPPLVLCYHGIGPAPAARDPHGLFVSEEAFAAQLDQLTGAGYRLVSAGELWDAVAEGGPVAARGLAAVTLDDGLADTLEVAARLLAERGGRGTAFLLPGLLGAPHPHSPEHRLVDADEVRALRGGPLEIGSHTMAHADLRLPRAEVVADDLRRSREALEALCGHPIRGLAYPFGRYTAATPPLAAAAGYDYACACSGAGPWRRLEVPREAVFPTTTPGRLRLKALGLNGPVARTAGWARRLRR